MSAEYVRNYYGIPAKRGMRVLADGKLGTVIGFDGAHLRIRLDGEKRTSYWHPTWRIEYQPTEHTE